MDEDLSRMTGNLAKSIEAANKAAVEAPDSVKIQFVLNGREAIYAHMIVSAFAAAYECTYQEAAMILFNITIERNINTIQQKIKEAQSTEEQQP